MARGLQRSQRATLVAQAALVWADDEVDTKEFIATGQWSKADRRMPYNPHVEKRIAEIEAAGGIVIIEPPQEVTDGVES
jgi:hypothetical protein